MRARARLHAVRLAWILGAAVLFSVPALGAEPGTIELLPSNTSSEALAVASLDELEAGALVALSVDTWLISNEDIAAAEFAVSRNLAAQQAAASQSRWMADMAHARREVAEDAVDVAAARQAELEDQVRAITVEAFMYADEARIGGFGNELQQVRDVTPNEAVATMLLNSVKRVESEVTTRVRREATLASRAAEDERIAIDRSSGLRRAQTFTAQFEQLKTDRNDEIRRREMEVLEESPDPGELVTVRGFSVSTSIGANLEAMLAAASEEGIELFGWGYRRTEEQIILRLAHCGNSGDAIFDRNANSCEPPTAQPLLSEHEKGLAIDFTENGAILNSSSPAFLWLKEHAAEYGFFNLPTEAWHWSTTGH